MANSSKWLTGTAWEKRIRRALDKYGYSLHKSRKCEGGYVVSCNSDMEDTAWYPSLDRLQDLVEYLREHYCA